jgi:hypothetical protein
LSKAWGLDVSLTFVSGNPSRPLGMLWMFSPIIRTQQQQQLGRNSRIANVGGAVLFVLGAGELE